MAGIKELGVIQGARELIIEHVMFIKHMVQKSRLNTILMQLALAMVHFERSRSVGIYGTIT